MITIHKYEVSIDETVFVTMPLGAEILTVALQHNKTCVWAKVNTHHPKMQRVFHWRGTGHDAEGLGHYVGTVQLEGGALVFHLFEGREP